MKLSCSLVEELRGFKVEISPLSDTKIQFQSFDHDLFIHSFTASTRGLLRPQGPNWSSGLATSWQG